MLESRNTPWNTRGAVAATETDTWEHRSDDQEDRAFAGRKARRILVETVLILAVCAIGVALSITLHTATLDAPDVARLFGP